MNKLVLTLTFGVLASSAFANPGHVVDRHAKAYAGKHTGLNAQDARAKLKKDTHRQAKANAKKDGKKLESNPEAKGDAAAAGEATLMRREMQPPLEL